MEIIKDYSDISNIKETAIADYALEKILKCGATQARVMLNMGEQNSISILNGDIDVLQGSADRSLYIQIYLNGKYGAYSTNILKKDSLDAFIKNAVEGTNLLVPDNGRILPDKNLYYTGFSNCTSAQGLKKTDLGQFDPTIFNISPQQKKDMTLETYQTMKDASLQGNKQGALISGAIEYADLVEYFYMKDSNGFKGESLQTTFNISAEVSIKGKNHAKPESWWYESSMFFNDFIKNESYKNTGIIALQRANAKLNPKKIKQGKYNIVIDTTCASRVIAPIMSAISGGNIQQKNSFLLDSIGKKMFASNVNLIDKPHLYGMTGSRYFDSEGVATKESNIILNGVLERYFINTYYSKKLDMPAGVEGASVPILYDNKNIRSTEELLKIAGTGVYITEFNGGNCNGVTGDFSYGIEGFYFENGEILFPIKELNITGNIITLWNNFIGCANNARSCTRWQIGSVAFENVNI